MVSGFHAILENLVCPHASMGKGFDFTCFDQADHNCMCFDGRELSLHALLRKHSKSQSTWMVPVY